MTIRKPGLHRTLRTQRGYALIGIIAAVGIAATTVLVTSLSTTAINNEQERKTNAALALAKLALIGRAAAGGPDGNHPGSLPCPDLGTGIVGEAAGTCSSVDQQIGRLPWKTLGLADLRDAAGERLWYAVSSNFRDVDTNIINSNTLGQISVTGTISASNVAAIVFAPGAQLDSQPRDSAHQNTISSFLEQPYIEKLVFTSQAAGDSFNDRLMVIEPADIFAIVQRRVAKEVQDALNAYFNQSYTVSTTATVDGVTTTTTTTKTNSRYPFAASVSNSNCLAGGNSDACVSVQDLTTGLIPGTPDAVNDFPPYSGTATLLGAGSADWFEANGWRQVVSYSVSPECATNSPAPCASGSINVTVNTTTLTNQKATLLFTGVPGRDDQRLKTTLLTGV
ncbi:MAG: hypothetical protein HY525_13630 [Betaproteobacteria bacterium]|nr:hypothetical protein [Betaproteobacteria bacterium]